MQGREVAAPDWLRVQIETRLADALPEAQISFGSIVAVLEQGWRPTLSVRDVQVRSQEGAEVVSFSNVEAGLDTAALLERRLSLSKLDVSGVFVSLRREPDGPIALSSGTQAGSVTRQAPTLVQLINELDEILLQPAVSALKQLNVDAITLRYEDERADRAWTIDGGRMRLTREGQALQIAVDLAILGGGAGVATLEANYAGAIDELASEFGVTITDLDAADIASQGPAFSWLQALNAPISGALRGGVNADGSFAPLNATLQIGAGVIQPTPQANPIPIQSARSYFTYAPDAKTLRFDELSVQSAWGSGRLEGQAVLGAIRAGQIEDMVGQLRLSDLTVNPAGLYPEPVNIEAAELDFRLGLAPFALELGRLDITDKGETLTAYGTLSADQKGWDIAVDGSLGALQPDRLLELWPARVVPKTRDWIRQNILGGDLSNISGALRLSQGERPLTYLSFDYDNSNVRFVKNMPPIQNGKGHGTLVDNRFVIVLDAGEVEAIEGGLLDVAGSSFIIPDVTAKPDPPAVVRLIANSSVTAALSMLDQRPLEVMQKANIPVSVAQGRAFLQGTIALPLKKKAPVEEISFDVSGVITDVRSDRLVKDRVLKAPLLELTGSEKGVRLSGAGSLDGVALDVVWTQPIGPVGVPQTSRVRGTAQITQAALQAFNIDVPAGMLSGTGAADIALDITKGVPPALTLSSDLQGLTLSIPPVSWGKAAQTPAQLDIAVRLGDDPQVEAITLDAPGLFAQGNIALNSGGTLDRIRLDTVRAGGWLDASVDLVGRGAGAPLGVELRGGTLDLRRAQLGGAGAGSGANTPLSVVLDRLQVSDTIAITDLRGDFSTGGGLDGAFEGAINGAAPVQGQIVPTNGRSAVRIRSNDAGRVFGAAGLLRQARDGQLDLVLRPVGNDGAFDGSLKVADARIMDAPAIAALLNSISIVGLVNELSGNGIFFDEITADFRMTPSRITLREASAVGSSMGLSMDGVYEPDSGRLDMQGVISPVYILNSIGSFLTRKGEGLFGFNYSISGTAKDPKVFVNPLSALAPGMLRNLFRGNLPEVELEDGEAPKPERRAPIAADRESR